MDAHSDVSRARVSLLAVDGKGIYFYFDKKKKSAVLKGVNIAVPRGNIYSLLGPSGCGKTTLLKCIIGQHKLQEGSLKIFGKNPGSEEVFIPGRGVGYMPQDVALYLEMTPQETLQYFGSLYLMNQQEINERISFLMKLLELPEKKRQIKHLSGGQQRRVSLAAALVHKPPLLILDEPTVGVDPLLRQAIWDHLRVLAKDEQLSIIITTHYIEEARQADVVGLMRDGCILVERNPGDLIRQYGVVTLEDVFLRFCRRNYNENEDHTACSNGLTFGTNSNVNCSEQNGTQQPQKEADELHQNSVETDHSFEVGGPRINEAFDGSCDVQDNNAAALSLPAPPNYNDVNFNRTISPFKESMMRLSCITNKNMLYFKRNITLMLLQIIWPSLVISFYFLGVGGDPFDLSVAVANMEKDPNEYSKMLFNSVSNHTIQQKQFGNLSLAIESVKNAESWAAIYIGQEFASCLVNRYEFGQDIDNDTLECSKVKLYMDMTDYQISRTIYYTLFKGFKTFTSDLLEKFGKNPSLADPLLVIENPVYGSDTTPFHEFVAPGVVLNFVFLVSAVLSSMAIVLEKKQGLLDRVFIAGATHCEVLLSLFLVTLLTVAVQVILVLIFTYAVFKITCLGSFFWVFISGMLVGISGMAYGLLVASICNDETLASLIICSSFIPLLIICGTIWPLEALPYYLRYVGYCLPLTLITYSMRSICSRGWSIIDHFIWDGYLVSIAWTSVFLVLALYFFKVRK